MVKTRYLKKGFLHRGSDALPDSWRGRHAAWLGTFPACYLVKSASRLLHEARLLSDGDAVHLAVNLVITVHQAYGFGFRSALEHGRAAQFQILDQHDAIAVREHVAVSIFDDTRTRGGIGGGIARPFVTAGATSQSAGNSSTSVISHIGQAGLLTGQSVEQPWIKAQSRIDVPREFQTRHARSVTQFSVRQIAVFAFLTLLRTGGTNLQLYESGLPQVV